MIKQWHIYLNNICTICLDNKWSKFWRVLLCVDRQSFEYCVLSLSESKQFTSMQGNSKSSKRGPHSTMYSKLCLQCLYFLLEPSNNHISKAFHTCTGVWRIIPGISNSQNGSWSSTWIFGFSNYIHQKLGVWGDPETCYGALSPTSFMHGLSA